MPPARPGPDLSRTWSPPRSRCPLAAGTSPRRWMPPRASWNVFPPIRSRVPAGRRDDPSRRLLRSGDRAAASAAAACAEVLVSRVPGDKLARHPDIRVRVLAGRGAVELWSGHLDEAAGVLQAAGGAESASGGQGEPADCLGYLALAEALRRRLRRAATVAGQAAARTVGQRRPVPHPSPAALVALASGAPGTL